MYYKTQCVTSVPACACASLAACAIACDRRIWRLASLPGLTYTGSGGVVANPEATFSTMQIRRSHKQPQQHTAAA